MSPQIVLDIMLESFTVGLLLSLPIMLSALFVGLIVSVFQAITSVQEQTLVFIPKIIAVVVASIVFFSWMMGKVMTYTVELFGMIPDLVR